jgi:hypothetical protein
VITSIDASDNVKGAELAFNLIGNSVPLRAAVASTARSSPDLFEAVSSDCRTIFVGRVPRSGEPASVSRPMFRSESASCVKIVHPSVESVRAEFSRGRLHASSLRIDLGGWTRRGVSDLCTSNALKNFRGVGQMSTLRPTPDSSVDRDNYSSGPAIETFRDAALGQPSAMGMAMAASVTSRHNSCRRRFAESDAH